MKTEELQLWIRGFPLLTAVLAFTFLQLVSVEHPPKIVLQACEDMAGRILEKSREKNWYRKTAGWLTRNGAAYHYGRWMNPTGYLALCLVLAIAGFGILSFWKIGYGVVAGILLFFLPGRMLVYLNKKDNEAMLPEIQLVYHALEIQIMAGVYVTDALSECYGSVKGKRIRQALLDLAGDIVMKADIYRALSNFRGKFDNPYIDSLCITIIQGLESGQAVELLGDIADQMKDMEGRLLERRKSSLDRSITFYQLGILAAVLGVVLYACIIHMFTTAVGF